MIRRRKQKTLQNDTLRYEMYIHNLGTMIDRSTMRELKYIKSSISKVEY